MNHREKKRERKRKREKRERKKHKKRNSPEHVEKPSSTWKPLSKCLFLPNRLHQNFDIPLVQLSSKGQ